MSLKDLAIALKLIKAADPKVIASMMDDAALAKAADSLRSNESTGLTSGEIVESLWDQGNIHGAPSREQIKTGPAQSASGAGAERMVDEYSSPARQHGVQLDAEKLERIMQPMVSAMKAQGQIVSQLVENAKATNTFINAIVAKAEEKEDDDEEDEEESEVVEINASKSKALIDKARRQLAKADALKEDASDVEDVTARKAMKAQSKSLRKLAAKNLVKARTYGMASRKAGVPLLKSIKEMIAGNAVLKADVDVVQEEEDDEEDEDDEAKAKAKAEAEAIALKANTGADAQKAKTDIAGNQADHQDTANGNQAAAAAKSIETVALEVTKALDGLVILQGSVNSMMDALAGKSRVGSDMPALVKGSTPDREASIMNAIVEAEDNGKLDIVNGLAARDIVSHMGLARMGQIDASIVQDRLEKAPAAVREIFRIAA